MPKGGDIDDAVTPRAHAGWFTDPWAPDRLRFFDGQQWTERVAPGPYGVVAGAPTNPLPESRGRPFGEQMLTLNALADSPGTDLSCSVENMMGTRLALFACRSRVPLVMGRDTRTLEFELLAADGMPLLTVCRVGGRGNDRVEARDTTRTEVGRIRQVSADRRQVRPASMTLALESRDAQLGSVELSVRPSGPLAEVPMAIHDHAGSTVAMVSRRRRKPDTAENAFDYTLSCPSEAAAPLPTLLLLTAFTLYLYDRLAVGGPVGFLGRWISRPTWEQ